MKHYHVISRLAIYLLALILFAFGVFHFLYPRDLLVYVPIFLIGGIKWAYVVGGAFILVALSFATNQFVKITSYVLVVLLIFFILTIHVPNFLHAGDKEMRQFALINILKDAAIAGFSLHIGAAAFHQHFQFDNND
jgi:putative oxidoreductase